MAAAVCGVFAHFVATRYSVRAMRDSRPAVAGRVSGRGRVVSWCTFGKRYYDELPVPWDAILVELEEGPLFVSNPDVSVVTRSRMEMPVAVDFVEAEDEAGVFRLPVFRKAQSS